MIKSITSEWESIGAYRRARVTIINDKVDYYINTEKKTEGNTYVPSRQFEINFSKSTECFMQAKRGIGEIKVEVLK